MIRVVDLISRGMMGLAGVAIVLTLLLVTCDVIVRAVFNIAIPGVDTVVASYLMVAIIFLPLALLHLLDENITVDVVRDHVPNMVKDLFDICAHLLGAIFYALLAWLYLKVAIESFEMKEYVAGTWDVPIWPARVFMPLGLGLASVATFAQLLEALQILIQGRNPSSHHATGAI